MVQFASSFVNKVTLGLVLVHAHDDIKSNLMMLLSTSHICCWPVRVSLLITWGGGGLLRSWDWIVKNSFGSFMISRPSLSFSHWWEFHIFFTREFCHGIILHVPAIGQGTSYFNCHVKHRLFMSQTHLA